MFREMRRKRQALPHEECEAILTDEKTGVLALLGDEGYPYAVPLNFAYADGKIYFHCARSGHKLDAIARCDKASFCVVAEDTILPAEFTTDFRSAVAFGRVRVVEDEGEMRAAVRRLAKKYSPEESDAAAEAEIERGFPALCVLEMTVEHLTGKVAIERLRGHGRP